MTDKIIIDGVDVSGCENFMNNYELKHNIDGSITYYNACECGVRGVENYHLECNYNDCNYKQLARKTEECESLKAYIKEDLAPHAQMLNQQLQAERQKVEELLSENNELKQSTVTLAEGLNIRQIKLEQYKQALEEIKPVLEYYANTWLGVENPNGTFSLINEQKAIILNYNPLPAKQALQHYEVVNE